MCPGSCRSGERRATSNDRRRVFQPRPPPFRRNLRNLRNLSARLGAVRRKKAGSLFNKLPVVAEAVRLRGLRTDQPPTGPTANVPPCPPKSGLYFRANTRSRIRTGASVSALRRQATVVELMIFRGLA